MQITLDPTLQNDTDLATVLSLRQPLIESVINGSATQAEWRHGTNWRGQPAVLLHLRDLSGSRVEAGFLPGELKNEQYFADRLRELGEAISKVHHWRSAVEKLFIKLRAWCDRLPERNVRGTRYQAFVRGQQFCVAEGPSGEYDITQLVVKRISTVRITPVAAWVVGWDGRVDLSGPGDRLSLLYRKSEEKWYHVPNDLPYREQPLTEELFLDLIETCLDEDADE